MQKGGKVELKTDNASYWYYSLDNKTHTGRYEQNQVYGKEDRHLSLYTDCHLINRFEEEGLKSIELEYLHLSGNPKSIKGKIVVLISKIFQKIRLLRRLGYSSIKIIGVKDD